MITVYISVVRLMKYFKRTIDTSTRRAWIRQHIQTFHLSARGHTISKIDTYHIFHIHNPWFHAIPADRARLYLQRKYDHTRQVHLDPTEQNLTLLDPGAEKLLKLKKLMNAICKGGTVWGVTVEEHII